MTDDGLIGQALKFDGYYVFVKHDFGTIEYHHSELVKYRE